MGVGEVSLFLVAKIAHKIGRGDAEESRSNRIRARPDQASLGGKAPWGRRCGLANGVAMKGLIQRVKAKADIKNNRLSLTISGHVDAKTLDGLYTDIRFCVADLKPGFDVICDVSQCNLLYLAGLPIYQKIMNYMVASRVGTIVRVTNSEQVSARQMFNLYERFPCYSVLHATSCEEAVTKLEVLDRRDGLRFHLTNVDCSYTCQGGQGQGVLVDISVSGCAVQDATVPVQQGEEVALTLGFSPHDKLPTQVQVQGEVIRVENDLFAVHFLNLDDEAQAQLYKRFVHEVNLINFVL